MLKKLSISSAGVLFLLFPVFASADTLSDLQVLVQQLQAQIASLQSSKGSIVPTATVDSDTPISGTVAAACPTLSLPLQRGSRDASTGGQVTNLQEFLAGYYDLNEEDVVTGYFGRVTESTVIRFQKQHGLPAFGIAGPMTRAKIAEVCGGSTTSSVAPSVIPPVTPSVTLPVTTQPITPTPTPTPTPIQTSAPTTTCIPPAPETQTLSCPTGQTGSITQTRSATCSVGATSPVWSAWISTSNTCVAATAATSYGPNVARNGMFDTWSSEPSSQAVWAGPSTGFAPNALPDGWYGGPGGGGMVQFNRGGFGAGQTDVPGNPRYYGAFTWTQVPTVGSDEYSVSKRASYIEQNGPLTPAEVAGKTFEFSFYARVSSGSYQVMPIIWLSTGQMGWLPGQNKVIGDYVMQQGGGLKLYRATSAGVTGANPPAHTSGSASDGGVMWEYVGTSKGRVYEIYEGGPNTTSAYATTPEGTPHQGAACTITTNFSKCSVRIKIPPLGSTDATTYAGTSDPVRTLLPTIDTTPMGGTKPYAGLGIDIAPLPTIPSGQAIWQFNIANVEVREVY